MARTLPKAREGFDRPNHPDFMDSSELKKAEFSGLRQNSISGDMEIWVAGQRRKTVSLVSMQLDKHAVEKAYAEVFGLDQCIVKK